MFTILKTIRDVRKGIHDPAGLGQELAEDVVRAPLILFTIIGVAFLGIMFLLGFTSVFSHPHLFFRVIFWFGLIPFIVMELIVWSLFRVFKKMVNTAKQKVSGKIINAEVVDKSSN
jgi:O-antigen/teichoic acid export membrane protein